MTICDRIAVLDQGVIQQVGSPLELYDHPANRFVAQFVGSVNIFEGAVSNDAGRWVFASGALGEWSLPAGVVSQAASRVDLAFRPHAVSLDPSPDDASLVLEGDVQGGEFLGEFIRYEIRVGQATVLADKPHARGAPMLPRGHKARLSVPSSELRILPAG